MGTSPKVPLQIERVWAQSKWYTRAYCKYSIHSVRRNITPALKSVSLETIKKHFGKVRHYMYAVYYEHREGLSGGSDLEKLVKKHKTEHKSHRRISEQH